MPREPVSHSSTRRRILVVCGVLGGLAVAAGAFAAHALQATLSPRMLEVWSTATRYHMWHTLAVLALACAPGLWSTRAALVACLSWIAGIVLFSGSLYLLALTGIGALGAITPVGGIGLIVGWVMLAVAAIRSRRE